MGSPTLLTTITGLGVYGLAAITGPLLARALGPAGRGDLAAVLVPSEMLRWVVMFGLPSAALYYADRHPVRDLVAASWAFAVVVGGLLTAAAWWFVPLYLGQHDPSTVTWLRLFLVVHIVFVPVTTTIQLLRMRPSLVAFNVLRSLQLVLETALIVVFALLGRLTLASALWATLVSYVVWYVVVLVYGRGWPSRRFNGRALRDMVSYGSRISVGAIANLAITRFDQLLLVGLVASNELGDYAVAATAAGLSSAVAGGVGTVLFADVRDIDDPHRAWTAVIAAAKRTLIWSAAVAGVVGLAAPFAIPLLFGSGFRGSVRPLLVLLPGQVVADVGWVVSQKLLADNRPGVVSHGLILAAVTTVAILSVAVGPFGIMGAALATVLSQVTFAGYVTFAARRQHRDVITGRRPAPERGSDITGS